ncbi:MAG: MotA/TolQ/ExbB proton channel family protein [Spirochaetaceae bacterium]
MLTLLDRGGLILVLIIVLSVIAVVIIVERLLFFRRIRVDESVIIDRLRTTLEKGHYDEALSICENNPSPVTNLMKVGIDKRHQSQETIKAAITDAANLEIPHMERYLSFLGTIAHISPLLGLLGTVTGNIRAFGVLGDFASAGGNPALLAQGISEALVTTAAGLIVAIPAIIFYNALVSKVNHRIIQLENRVTEMVFLLKGEQNAV